MNFPQDQFKIQNQSYTNPYFVNRNVGQNQEMLCCESDDNLPNLREETSNKYDDLENELMKAKEEEEYRRWDDDDEPNKNIFEFKEINILSANIKENPFLNPKGMDVPKEEISANIKENPFLNPKGMDVPKEENIQPIFHLFTKRPDDQIDYIKEYSETPTFKDFNLINDEDKDKDKKKKNNQKRKFNMDNMSKIICLKK